MSDFEDDFEDDLSDSEDYGASPSPVVVKTKAPKAKAAPPKKKAAASKKAEKENEEEFAAPVPKGKTKNAAGGTQSIEEAYQKLTQLEHVLKRPDTYIGSTQMHEHEMWVYNSFMGKMEHKTISFPPGLYKIFDEILVNAADNAQRSDDEVKMKAIKVTIDQTRGEITVWNDGRGIPVEEHKKEKMPVPEMIFGHLLTGTNFNDDIRKVTGGRNGFGAKLTNIFSHEFTVECMDSSRHRKYTQTWTQNMGTVGKAHITSDSRKNDYVQIKFRPDLSKFNVDSFTDDIYQLFCKRVYDIAGCNPSLSVYLNGQKLPIRSFRDYVNLYPLDTKEDGKPFTMVYEAPNERWEVAATVSTSGEPHQVSFVNSIVTYDGGSHVTHVTDAIAKALETKLNTKTQKNAPITKKVIKQHLWVFIRCLIENPSFNSQTKEKLASTVKQFGSRCSLGEEFFTKLSKSGIKEYVLRAANFKAQKALKNKGGRKVDRLRGIEKLDDANLAGTKRGKECTLIVTEGDSAKTLAVCGLSVVGRDLFGVFPLRGKPLNVRGASTGDLLKNKEIKALVQILGLKFQHKYESLDGLRYGKLMIMADQDVDGSHIKGLILNFIDVHWPELLKQGFCVEFITPIVKAKKGKESWSFYTLPEYQAWKETPASKGAQIKYYKGLGTSERSEAREYFTDLKKHRIAFNYRGEMDRQTLDLAFNKSKASERKDWISSADPKDFLDTKKGTVTVADFMNKEMVHFSVESVNRAIPSVMDGWKPSHRKVLYGCFKRNLIKPIKVAQLAGYVSEKAAYHHGEASLQSTIVGMAQNFVGSNNINVLYPEGQFGSRLLGGSDASAARYIFTKLAPLTRKIFHPHDDALLTYLEDDGFPVEPEFYVPILPMILVNGASGIATGWSTSIPNFNPRDIVANLRRLLRGEEPEDMKPWYMGFKGSIEARDWSKSSYRNQYEVRGLYDVDGDEVNITELPVQTWTQQYKDFIEENLVDAPTPKACVFADYKEYHTDTNVDFQIKLAEGGFDKLNSKGGGFEKSMKLVSTLSVSNLMAMGPDGKIHKYESVGDILKEFFKVRLEFYVKRKEHLKGLLTEEWEILDNKVRFIEAVIADSCKVRGKAKKGVVEELMRCGFKKFALKKKTNKANADEDAADEDDLFGDKDEAKDDSENYDYLLRMPIYSLTKEKADLLRKQRDSKREELDIVLASHPKKMWSEDLDEFMVAYDEFETEVAGASSASESTRNLKSKARTGKGAAKKKTETAVPAKKKKTATTEKAVPAKKKATLKKKASSSVDSPAASDFLDTSAYGAGNDDDDDDEELNDSDLELLDMDEDDLLAYSTQKAPKPGSLKRFSLSDDEDDDLEPVRKKLSPPKQKKAAAAPKAKKTAAAPKAKKATTKKRDSSPPPPKELPKRKRAAKSYVVDDEEDDFEEDDGSELDMELLSDEEDDFSGEFSDE